jgi:nucleotide-binding universal stress UspA family protein
LHVWHTPAAVGLGDIPPDLESFARNEAGRAMEDCLEELRRSGFGDEDSLHGRLASGDAATAILDAVEDGRYDLVVMGRNGRGRLEHLFMGSVAESVSRRAACPVLTLHAEPPRRRTSVERRSQTIGGRP